MRVENKTIKVTGGSLFAALSIILAVFIAPIVPRLGWGIAIIDPVSVTWILSFLIFGFLSGIICSLAGFIGLFLVDPFIPWGPIFILFATLPLIIIPYAIVKTHSKDANVNEEFSSIKKYMLLSSPAILVRCVIMLLANVLFFWFIMPYAINQFGGLLLISVFVIFINIEQSFWDLYLPWVIVYKTKIYTVSSNH